MLTEQDLQFIMQNRAELKKARTKQVYLLKETVVGNDDFTGDPIYGTEEILAEPIWQPVTTQSPGNPQIHLIDGIEVRNGDVIADFDITDDLDGVDWVRRVDNDETYVIRAKEPIGLGGENRIHVMLRKES